MSAKQLLSQILVVMRKELTDARRDRRALYSVALAAFVGPLLIGFTLNRLADRQRQVDDVRLPIVGAENAPALVEWLKQQSGISVVAGPADPEKAVRDRSAEVVLVIPKDFVERFRVSRPAPVKVISDGSRTTTRPVADRVRSLLQAYSSQIAAMRLVNRGVSPTIVTPVRVDDVEVSSAQERAATILNFIPLFMLLTAFTGGMQIATDSTAGERERGSLEPLLINPAPRTVLAAGKWLAAALAAAISVVINTALSLTILQFIPLQEFGVRFRLDVLQVVLLLAASLPACLLATATQTFLATFARSFKEAQTYMGLLIMLPMVVGMVELVYPFADQPWMYPIPILGQHLLLTQVIGGKYPLPVSFAVAALIAVAVSVLLVAQTARLFLRERIIFGR